METSEFIGVIRDLAIILVATVGLLVLMAITMMGFMLYRKVSPLLDSTKATMKTDAGGNKSSVGQFY